MSEPMSDERRAQIDRYFKHVRTEPTTLTARVMALELAAEVDRLRSDLEAARRVVDAATNLRDFMRSEDIRIIGPATSMAVAFRGINDPSEESAVRGARSRAKTLSEALAALAEHTGDDE